MFVKVFILTVMGSADCLRTRSRGIRREHLRFLCQVKVTSHEPDDNCLFIHFYESQGSFARQRTLKKERHVWSVVNVQRLMLHVMTETLQFYFLFFLTCFGSAAFLDGCREQLCGRTNLSLLFAEQSERTADHTASPVASEPHLCANESA